MMNMNQFLNQVRRRRDTAANDHGYNTAFLGLDNCNPYPIGSSEYVEFNSGYIEATLSIDELNRTPSTRYLYGCDLMSDFY